MKILLDTCEFLWLISGDSRLRVQVKEAIQSSENEVFLSVVSHCEVIVKFALGVKQLLFCKFDFTGMAG